MAEYRRGALRCPSCDEILAEELHGEAHVDICPTCQGIWIDWLDGDIAAVTAAVGERGEARPGGGEGTQHCPLCAHPLDRTTLEDEAAVIWRCGSCAGAFVPRSSAAVIAARGAEDEERSGGDPLLTRVLDAVGRFLLG
jgi:Zn-finger nucleic acid-binding protein